MSQYSAVYYPHTTLRSKDLLQTSLLLWDYVDCIVPWSGFSVTEGLSGLAGEAAEIVLRPRHPTPAEKSKVHSAVAAAFEHGAPSWATAALLDDDGHGGQVHRGDHDYLIYAEKFMHETWHELSRAAVARRLPSDGDYEVPPALGLTLMASLADACAGGEQHKVTDRVNAYSALAGMTTLALGGEFLQHTDPSEVTEDIERLVTISTNVLDGSAIPMKNLIALRKREANESSHDLRRLRHKYLDALSLNLKAISTAKTINDASELARQFRETMEEDLADLKKELRMARTDVLLSKEMGALLIAGVGAFAASAFAPAFAPLIKSAGVGALFKNAIEFRRARADALREHAMSWLYLARHPIKRLLK